MRLRYLLTLGLLSACGGNPTGGDGEALLAEANDAIDGQAAYVEYCGGCHDSGVTLDGIVSSPILGDPASWQGRTETSADVLMQHAREGYRSMPGKAGQPDLDDETVNSAVQYMLSVTFPDGPPGQ